jgi:enoyl-CoA hydratase/carnithine racemase
MLRIEDADRVRLVTIDRPESLNAFNEALYDRTAQMLIDTAADPEVSVMVITGTGRAFSAGTDIKEWSTRSGGDFVEGQYGFPGMVDQLTTFPKPFICAVNGVAIGIGATMLGFADLAFMAADARLKCPFTDLGVAPEAGSSFTFPRLLGRQNASWVLLSSEWFTAEQCKELGLVWKVCEPDQLVADAMAHARVLASKPLGSLMESKQAIIAAWKPEIEAARAREDAAFVKLMAEPANQDALAAFTEGRG